MNNPYDGAKQVVVAVARGYRDNASIRRELSRLPVDCVVYTGRRILFDYRAHEIAEELGLIALRYSDFDAFITTAIDYIMVFEPDAKTSTDTELIIDTARSLGIPVTVFDR